MSHTEDSDAVACDEVLLRRIAPDMVIYEDGQPRPPSAAFRDGYTDELSVHRAQLTSTDEIRARYPEVYLAAITVRDASELGYVVRADPRTRRSVARTRHPSVVDGNVGASESQPRTREKGDLVWPGPTTARDAE